MRAAFGGSPGVVRDVPRQPDPVGEPRAPRDHAGGRGDHRPRPVGADDDPRRRRFAHAVGPRPRPSSRGDGRRARRLAPRRPAGRRAGRGRRASSSAGSSADRSNPTAGSPPASAPYVSSNAVPAGSRRASRGWVGRPRRPSRRHAQRDAAPRPRRATRRRRRPASATPGSAPATHDRCPARARQRAAPPRGPAADDGDVDRAPPAVIEAARSAGRVARVRARSRIEPPRSRPGGPNRADLRHRPQAARREQRPQLDPRVRPPHRERPVVARVPVAGRRREQARGHPVEPGPDEVVHDDAAAREPRRLREERDGLRRLEVVDEQRRVDDVERAIRPGQRPPVADHQLQARRSWRCARRRRGRRPAPRPRSTAVTRSDRAVDAARAGPVGCPRRRCRRRAAWGTGRPSSSRPSARVDAAVPPSRRLIHARSRRLPRRAPGRRAVRRAAPWHRRVVASSRSVVPLTGRRCGGRPGSNRQRRTMNASKSTRGCRLPPTATMRMACSPDVAHRREKAISRYRA